MDLQSLPADGFLRLKEIIGDRRANPPVRGVFPVSKTTWYTGIANGFYPPGYNLGPRAKGWKVSDIRELLERFGTSE